MENYYNGEYARDGRLDGASPSCSTPGRRIASSAPALPPRPRASLRPAIRACQCVGADGAPRGSTGPGGGLAAPVLAHLCLSDTIREVLDVGDDFILGSDWTSRHDQDTGKFYADSHVSLGSWPARLQLHLLPAEASPAARAISVLSHAGLRRLRR